MASAFAPLRDDRIRARLRRAQRAFHAAHHERHLRAHRVRALDIGLQRLVAPRPSERDDRRLLRQRRLVAFFVDPEEQEVQPVRLARHLANRLRRRSDLLHREVMAPERPQAARLAHRGHHPRRID